MLFESIQPDVGPSGSDIYEGVPKIRGTLLLGVPHNWDDSILGVPNLGKLPYSCLGVQGSLPLANLANGISGDQVLQTTLFVHPRSRQLTLRVFFLQHRWRAQEKLLPQQQRGPHAFATFASSMRIGAVVVRPYRTAP